MRQIIIHLSSIAVFLSALLLVIRLFMLLWQWRKPDILSKRKMYFLAAETLTLALILISCTSVFLLYRNDFSRDFLHREVLSRNMDCIFHAFNLYAAGEKGNFYPPLTISETYWTPELSESLIDDAGLFSFTDPLDTTGLGMLGAMEFSKANPYKPDPKKVMDIMAEHFIYFGYSLKNMVQARKLAMLRREGKLDPDTVQEDIPGVYRLRRGLVRYLITDINNPGASVAAVSPYTALMTKKPYYHFGKKGYYLVMIDGTFQFIESGERFPALQEVVELFAPEK